MLLREHSRYRWVVKLVTDETLIGPSPRVYGVAIRDKRVLLVRASNPHDGDELWWLPGGGVDWGESTETALEREFAEETSLHVDQRLLCSVYDDTRRRTNGEQVHTLRVIYLVTVHPGEIQHEADGSTDLAEWVALDSLHHRRLAPYAEYAISYATELMDPAAPHDEARSRTLAQLRAYAGF